MKKLLAVISAFAFMLFSCKNEVQKSINTKESSISVEDKIHEENDEQKEEDSMSNYMPFTINDSLADEVSLFLKEKYLDNDYEFLSKNDRKFQMAEVDLNNDGENEIFINFFSSYFCGTGGCTLLLLNSDLNVINKFSVTRTPLFISKITENGWRKIMVKSQGKYVYLISNGTSYPSNPTVISPTEEAPTGHDLILFDDNFSPSKTYTF